MQIYTKEINEYYFPYRIRGYLSFHQSSRVIIIADYNKCSKKSE